MLLSSGNQQWYDCLHVSVAFSPLHTDLRYQLLNLQRCMTIQLLAILFHYSTNQSSKLKFTQDRCQLSKHQSMHPVLHSAVIFFFLPVSNNLKMWRSPVKVTDRSAVSPFVVKDITSTLLDPAWKSLASIWMLSSLPTYNIHCTQWWVLYT